MWNLRTVLTSFGARTSGEPPSRNGASSFHLNWDVNDRSLIECSAVVEVVVAPVVDRLHFWALQVSFAEPAGGTGHTGLQHNRRYPVRRTMPTHATSIGRQAFRIVSPS